MSACNKGLLFRLWASPEPRQTPPKGNIYLNESVAGKRFGIRRCPEQVKASAVFEYTWTASLQIVIWILAFQFPQGSSARTLIRKHAPACIPVGATTDLRNVVLRF